jgi:predicted dehydrogenase
MEPVRLGLIGCGAIARSAHLPAMARLGNTVKLVAVADTNLRGAETTAEAWGAAPYTNYEALLARKDVGRSADRDTRVPAC